MVSLSISLLFRLISWRNLQFHKPDNISIIFDFSEKYIKFDGLVDNVRKILAEEKRKSRQASLRSASTSDSDPMATYDLLRKDTIL